MTSNIATADELSSKKTLIYSFNQSSACQAGERCLLLCSSFLLNDASLTSLLCFCPSSFVAMASIMKKIYSATCKPCENNHLNDY